MTNPLQNLLRRLVLGSPKSLGARGEQAAARHLKNRGYRIILRNTRSSVGEVDLLAEAPDRRTVVVVEVKSRVVRGGGSGKGGGKPGEKAESQRLPERAITKAKGRKLATLAQSVATKLDEESKGRGPKRGVRIDVVAVDFEPGGQTTRDIRHYPNAINATGQRV